MTRSPVRSADLHRYCRRISDLTNFRLEHVDLLFDRANDNAGQNGTKGSRQAPEPRQPSTLNP